MAATERIFSTELAVFRHAAAGRTAVTLAPGARLSLPAELSAGIAFVTELAFLGPGGVRTALSPRLEGGADPVVVPETILKLYNVSEYGAPGVVQAAGEFGGNWHQNSTDLRTFGLNVEGRPFNLSKVMGHPDDPAEPVSGETTLDIQYISGVCRGCTNELWNSGGWVFEMTQLLQNASAAELPSVMSLSYGWSEAKQCGTVVNADCRKLGLDNNAYVNRTNYELKKVGLLGVTVLASSGDSGCHGRTDKICLFNAKMHPAYPASSPFVTAVGGTQFDRSQPVPTAGATSPICRAGQPLADRCAMGGVEVVSSTQTGSRITSGGGFSNVAPRPQYQDAAVAAYLEKIPDLSKSLYNAQGRGYPDISALAHNFYIEIDGRVGSEDGTSASSPTIGGIVSLLNTHRKRMGRPNVGFLNPLLYQIHAETKGAAFNDIVQGSNRCTESGCECHTGFTAVEGWDAATGLGTPNYGRLVAAMDAIDARRESH